MGVGHVVPAASSSDRAQHVASVGFVCSKGEHALGWALEALMDGVPRCLVVAGMRREGVEVACMRPVEAFVPCLVRGTFRLEA